MQYLQVAKELQFIHSWVCCSYLNIKIWPNMLSERKCKQKPYCSTAFVPLQKSELFCNNFEHGNCKTVFKQNIYSYLGFWSEHFRNGLEVITYLLVCIYQKLFCFFGHWTAKISSLFWPLWFWIKLLKHNNNTWKCKPVSVLCRWHIYTLIYFIHVPIIYLRNNFRSHFQGCARSGQTRRSRLTYLY